jgi:anti-anti-sigma regulatory factor
MRAVSPGWDLDVRRGPDCLIVKLRSPDRGDPHESSLADQLWSLLELHFVYRVVLELDELTLLNSDLVGELVLLQKRVRKHNGLVRLCGLSAKNRRVLRVKGLVDRFPAYDCLQEAVMGSLPRKPR